MSPPTEPCVVLVVDDDDDVRFATARVLEKAGYPVATASGGLEALRMVETERPEIVVLDVIMEDLDGVEACRRIKLGHPDGRPLILLASNKRITPSDRARGLSFGADGYLNRPVTAEELLAQVQAFERIARALRGREAPGDGPAVQLTGREREICGLIMMGQQSKEIADLLNLSVHTVNTHRKRIRRKFGVTGRGSLVGHLRSL